MVEKRCVCACACVLAQSSSGVQRTFCGALVSEPGSSHRSVVLAGIPSPPVPGMESVTGCRGLRRTPARSPPQNKTLRRHDAATRTSGTTTSSSQALLLLAALLVPCGNGAPRRHRTSETANRAIVCGTIALPPIAVVVAVGAAAVRRTPVRTHGCCRNGKRNPRTPSDETNASVSHLGMSEQPDQTRPDQTNRNKPKQTRSNHGAQTSRFDRPQRPFLRRSQPSQQQQQQQQRQRVERREKEQPEPRRRLRPPRKRLRHLSERGLGLGHRRRAVDDRSGPGKILCDLSPFLAAIPVAPAGEACLEHEQLLWCHPCERWC
mmetsp:Transcript_19362/g.39804  ORF Transcript_19362/g.39804 Transcript_19362/m.39804 type:complete len:320 (+) Transcript_19362:749-1708(+)